MRTRINIRPPFVPRNAGGRLGRQHQFGGQAFVQPQPVADILLRRADGRRKPALIAAKWLRFHRARQCRSFGHDPLIQMDCYKYKPIVAVFTTNIL